MEKDKLMELINSVVDERENIKNEIKKQTENKVLNGLKLMKQCLKYANEMKCYFDKMGCNPITEYICNSGYIGRPIYWFYGNNKKIGFSYHCFNTTYIYLEDLQNFETYIENLECDISCVAKILVANEYTFEKFKHELNEMLANEIMLYKKKNNDMAKNISK